VYDNFLTIPLTAGAAFSLTSTLTQLPFNPAATISSDFYVAQVNTSALTGSNTYVEVARKSVADRSQNFVAVTRLPIPYSPGRTQMYANHCMQPGSYFFI
jgi:hypothetical protein